MSATLSSPHLQGLIAGLPVVSLDQQAVFADLVTWGQSVPGLDAASIAPSDLARMLIHSQHLQGLAKRHPSDIAAALGGHGNDVITAACLQMLQAAQDIRDEAAFMKSLRKLRQRSALVVALADLANANDISTQMGWLSKAADTAVQATVTYLFAKAAEREKCPKQPAHLAGCGWTILALGKLGAGELNYSSDIDLIILHDPANTPLFAPDTAQQFYVEQTRILVRLLSQTTADGIGWRVDLRLRPDPGATAVSIQIGAALSYYESIARTWERAAFIRARPVAGDIALGINFLADIQPFIWRRTLDYTVLDDMKSMLRRPVQNAGWLGYNVKSGKNGIRQIEFFTHVLQLVTGGRTPDIRQPCTLAALHALAQDEWISQDQAHILGAVYHGLRRVEHRLQMIADTQTHSLPRGGADLARFAGFLGHQQTDDFITHLDGVMRLVGEQTTHKLLGGEKASDHGDNLLLDDKDKLFEWLTAHGFERPGDVAATLDGWMAGRIAATRSERARALLNNLMPTILGYLADGSAPDDQFAAFAQFAEGLPASVQIFSLLDHNRQLTKLLCDVLTLSPRMATYLRRYPTLFDLVLFDDFFAPLPGAHVLQNQLQQAITGLDVESALDEIKRRTREWRFRSEVQALSRVLPSSGLSLALSAIADSVVRTVHQLACQDIERRHGKISGESIIIALGRLGIGALTAQSDLDLVIVYTADDDAQSDGMRAVGAATYFTRLTQTFVSWMSSASAEGSLYEIDMRLRPDGDKSSIAVQIDRFEDYYAHEAWVWEKLALAKARFITRHDQAPKLGKRLDAAIKSVTQTPLGADDVGQAIHQMRMRLRKTYGEAPALQLRKLPGGLAELDLLVQGLRQIHAGCFVSTGQTPLAIIDTLLAEQRLNPHHGAALITASLLFSDIHNNLRLCLGSVSQNAEKFSPAVIRFLVENSDVADEAHLIAALAAERENVTLLFDSIFPAPAPSSAQNSNA